MPYLGGLDGLRAIAVMAVLAYHADTPGWQGGFLGVEVFFVISGYLITSILLAEWQTRRRIDLKTFYIRRARRLLPALFALLAGVALISVIFLPDEVATLRGDIGASLAYVTNWFFIVGQKSYFETSGRPSLVQHLWSLAVEEQFYLLWPLLFTAGMRWLGRRRLLVALLIGTVVSSALMVVLYHPGEDPSRVYYGTDTRAAGILLGSALAFAWTPYRLRRNVGKFAPILLDVLGVVALGVLVVQLMVADQFSDTLYRGGFLQVAVVTSVVIAVVAHPAAHLGKLLGIRPLRWIGLRSYGIYLYHWPIFQLTRSELDVPVSGVALFVLRFGLTFGIAAASYKYLETPIRSGAWKRSLARFRAAPRRVRRQRAARWGGVGLAGIVSMVLLTAMVLRAEPPPPPDYLLAGSVSAGLPPAPAPVPAGGTSGTDGTGGTLVAARPLPARLDPADPSGGSVPLVTTTTASAIPPTTLPIDPAAPPVAPPATMPDGAPVPPPAKRITAIGDSVMLGAAGALKSDLPGDVFVDARVGRQVSECIDILRVWRDQGLLGDVVIVHIGNNGTFDEDQMNQMRKVLAAAPKVIFLNNKVPRRWEEPNNQILASGVAAMPNAVLIDWKAEGDAHPELFAKDGMHLGAPGATFYASLVVARL